MTTPNSNATATRPDIQERQPKSANGFVVMISAIILALASIPAYVIGGTRSSAAFIVVGSLAITVSTLLFCGLRVLRPNEALVLTLFGAYHGTLRGPGFFFVNPFVVSVNPTAADMMSLNLGTEGLSIGKASTSGEKPAAKWSKKISLKTMTLDNNKQKINDQLGNPIIIGIVVIWRVVNTAKAVFSVDNYTEFLSIQCDSALRNIVRLYPYDAIGDDNEKSLRGSSQEVADMLKAEIQDKVEVAGLEIVEARITHLAYAPEIAAAMLQRQQASAIIDARQMIVEGAVGMVELALNRLNENDIVHLDEERKAAMVSNLLVVLCGNRDAQPVVNSGSLY